MSDTWTILRLFPENGLDRSLHVPVYLGLIWLSFFRETLGWTFAGLVVPGYLATVFLAAPVTGALVIVEATLTYTLALLLGKSLPRAGFGFTFFGRERFLLLIACGSFVRLILEASAVPWLVERLNASHSRELYSLGLVLVPLLANSFWNAGFVRAFPRVGAVTALTYAMVAELLLPYTNFTLSRFQVANESVSLAFVESPHAHMILLVGALLAARSNVRYGWDYNGILVPALLAVAWYTPSKVFTTVGEAIVVYGLSRALVSVPPLSRAMVVGSRKILLTFSVGFVVKYLLGMALFRWFPHIELLDFFGFGYLLPSLLANKMWDRHSIAGVLMPTLQVSLVAFPVGTALGFLLRSVEASAQLPEVQATQTVYTPSVTTALTLGDLAPIPERSGSSGRFVDAYRVAEQYLGELQNEQEDEAVPTLPARSNLIAQVDPVDKWTIVTPRDENANTDPVGPRVAVRHLQRYGERWLILVDTDGPASPAIAIASRLAEHIGGRAIVLRSQAASVAARDTAFALHLAESLSLDHLLVIRLVETGNQAATLQPVGAVPDALALTHLSEVVQVPVTLRFRPLEQTNSALDRAVILELRQADAERAAAQLAQTPAVERWHLTSFSEWERQLDSLTESDPVRFAVPTIRQLRLYNLLLAEQSKRSGPPGPWQQALASHLGLRFAKTSGLFDGWALFEPTGPLRSGLPTVLQRVASPELSTLAIELAAPRWQRGGIATALRLTHAGRAQRLLVHGTLVNTVADGTSDPRRPSGAKLWFQRAHEQWLELGRHAVMLRALAAARAGDASVVVGLDAEGASLDEAPDWSHPLLDTLRSTGLSLRRVNGQADTVGLSASSDPAVAYARRFAPGRSMVLWLPLQVRRSLTRAETATPWRSQLLNQGIALAEQRLSQQLSKHLRCLAEPHRPDCLHSLPSSACEGTVANQHWETFEQTGNPLFLHAALAQANDCGWSATLDPQTGTVWMLQPSSRDGNPVSIELRALRASHQPPPTMPQLSASDSKLTQSVEAFAALSVSPFVVSLP